MLSYFLIRFLFNFFSTHFYTNWRVKGKNRNIFLFQIFSSFSLSIFFSSKKKFLFPNISSFSISVFVLLKEKNISPFFYLSLQKNIFLLQIFSSLSFSVFFSSAKKISLLQTFSPFSSRSFLRDPIFPYLLFFCHSGS